MGDDLRTTSLSEPPSRKRRFQFGLKHVLAAPMVVAGFFALAAWVGVAFAALITLGVVGFSFRATRAITAVGCLVFFLVLLLLPAVNGRPASPRAQCMNNLKQIALALLIYHDVHKCFPPAYIPDKNGRPMHSWRVLILPYMDQTALYQRYNFNEPWDGPNNRKLANVAVPWFACPEDGQKSPTMTSYVAVVGPETAWPGSKPTKLADFTDGRSNTLLLVEVKDSGIHWMEPRDLHVVQMAPGLNPKAGQGISSHHPDGANAALADGSVRYLAEERDPDTVRALLTISGGEKVEP